MAELNATRRTDTAENLSYAASRRWGKANALGCKPATMRLFEDLIDSACRYRAELALRKAKHDG